ncbi:RNA polymerase sigma factor [Streptomyces oceani]|uniref:RNA polymerase subunit sigma-70 n=1 Tax=Streptomyces oceani TaxID=1075402 RepID=A0A1E7KNJ7_9ACTN|nr:RNA polymerase sigma factor [Streptomyces oceani]OEV05454.1 RNA polymerase subunit sigma-70 [Streptomyces oceani]
MNTDDSRVIERSLTAPEAFTTLYDRHAAAIHRYATFRLGDDHADDIVAETFLVAFRKRQRYDRDRADARPWLYGIASNLISKHRRFEARSYRMLARIGQDPVAESYADRIEARVSAESWRRPLAEALARLSARDRDVLLLTAWADLSYEETARALAIPVGTVRSRLNRARKQMRKALGDAPTVLQEAATHG